MIKKLWNEFLNSSSKKEFPLFSASTILPLLGYLALHKPQGIFEAFCNLNPLKKTKEIRLPNSTSNKPVILLDPKNLLYCDKFSLKRFDLISLKRSYAEEFIFGMSQYYEIITISENYVIETNKLLKKIDPFGCISNRIFLENKKSFDKASLNRSLDKLAIISTVSDEFNSDLKNNVLLIKKWSGKEDTKILDLIHFFTNIHYMGLKDFRKTIKSYQGQDFSSTFNIKQKILYKQRNMANFFSRNSFDEKLAKVSQIKTKEYKKAKEMLETLNNNQKGVPFIVGKFLYKLFAK